MLGTIHHWLVNERAKAIDIHTTCSLFPLEHDTLYDSQILFPASLRANFLPEDFSAAKVEHYLPYI